MKFYKDIYNQILCVKRINDLQYTKHILQGSNIVEDYFKLDNYNYDMSPYFTKLTKAESDLIQLKLL